MDLGDYLRNYSHYRTTPLVAFESHNQIKTKQLIDNIQVQQFSRYVEYVDIYTSSQTQTTRSAVIEKFRFSSFGSLKPVELLFKNSQDVFLWREKQLENQHTEDIVALHFKVMQSFKDFESDYLDKPLALVYVCYSEQDIDQAVRFFRTTIPEQILCQKFMLILLEDVHQINAIKNVIGAYSEFWSQYSIQIQIFEEINTKLNEQIYSLIGKALLTYFKQSITTLSFSIQQANKTSAKLKNFFGGKQSSGDQFALVDMNIRIRILADLLNQLQIYQEADQYYALLLEKLAKTDKIQQAAAYEARSQIALKQIYGQIQVISRDNLLQFSKFAVLLSNDAFGCCVQENIALSQSNALSPLNLQLQFKQLEVQVFKQTNVSENSSRALKRRCELFYAFVNYFLFEQQFLPLQLMESKIQNVEVSGSAAAFKERYASNQGAYASLLISKFMQCRGYLRESLHYQVSGIFNFAKRQQYTTVLSFADTIFKICEQVGQSFVGQITLLKELLIASDLLKQSELSNKITQMINCSQNYNKKNLYGVQDVIKEDNEDVQCILRIISQFGLELLHLEDVQLFRNGLSENLLEIQDSINVNVRTLIHPKIDPCSDLKLSYSSTDMIYHLDRPWNYTIQGMIHEEVVKFNVKSAILMLFAKNEGDSFLELFQKSLRFLHLNSNLYPYHPQFKHGLSREFVLSQKSARLLNNLYGNAMKEMKTTHIYTNKDVLSIMLIFKANPFFFAKQFVNNVSMYYEIDGQTRKLEICPKILVQQDTVIISLDKNIQSIIEEFPLVDSFFVTHFSITIGSYVHDYQYQKKIILDKNVSFKFVVPDQAFQYQINDCQLLINCNLNEELYLISDNGIIFDENFQNLDICQRNEIDDLVNYLIQQNHFQSLKNETSRFVLHNLLIQQMVAKDNYKIAKLQLSPGQTIFDFRCHFVNENQQIIIFFQNSVQLLKIPTIVKKQFSFKLNYYQSTQNSRMFTVTAEVRHYPNQIVGIKQVLIQVPLAKQFISFEDNIIQQQLSSTLQFVCKLKEMSEKLQLHTLIGNDDQIIPFKEVPSISIIQIDNLMKSTFNSAYQDNRDLNNQLLGAQRKFDRDIKSMKQAKVQLSRSIIKDVGVQISVLFEQNNCQFYMVDEIKLQNLDIFHQYGIERKILIERSQSDEQLILYLSLRCDNPDLLSKSISVSFIQARDNDFIINGSEKYVSYMKERQDISISIIGLKNVFDVVYKVQCDTMDFQDVINIVL